MAKVMVVDDTAFMRLKLKQILKEFGHEIVGEAENGKIAVDKYKSLDPDIVFMDITMPEMDGIEAVKTLKEIDSDVQVVICSAMGQKKIVLEAIKSGAKDFIVKPFKKGKIEETINKLNIQ